MNIYTGWAAINIPKEYERMLDRKLGLCIVRHPIECEQYFRILYFMSDIIGKESLLYLINEAHLSVNLDVNNKYVLGIYPIFANLKNCIFRCSFDANGDILNLKNIFNQETLSDYLNRLVDSSICFKNVVIKIPEQ